MRTCYLFALCLSLMWIQLVTVYAQDDCPVQTMDEAIITPGTGQLLYVPLDSRELWHIGSRVRGHSPGYRTTTISPDASHIALLELIIDRGIPLTSRLIIRNMTTDNKVHINIVANEAFVPHIIEWVNYTELLLTYVPLVDVSIDYIPFSLINIESKEVSYVYPTHYQYLFDEYGFETNPFLPYTGGEFNSPPLFSPDGQLIRYNNPDPLTYSIPDSGEQSVWYPNTDNLLFDTRTRTVLEKDNVRGDIWSPDSRFLLDLERELDDDNNRTYELYRYDIAEDEVQLIHSFENMGRQDLYAHSLSVNNLLAVEHVIPVDRETFPKVDGQLNILNTITGQLIETCFFARSRGASSLPELDAEWSLGGRYLAFFGAERSASQGGIYIYDSEMQITYRVYSGDAYIVGWTNYLNQNE